MGPDPDSVHGHEIIKKDFLPIGPFFDNAFVHSIKYVKRKEKVLFPPGGSGSIIPS
jgi:hypothetical protein